MAASRPGLLRYPADTRSLGFHASWFALVAVQWAMVPTNPVVAVPLYALTCLLSFVGAVHVHNVIHCPMFRERWLNDANRIAMSLWYGQPVSVFIPVHNHSHHKYAQTRRDVTRSTKVDGDWQLANMARATGWGREAGRDVKAYIQAQQEKGSRFFQQFRMELVAVILFGVVLLALSWWKALLYVFIPQMVGRFCIKAINYLQHDGCDYDLDGYNHSRNFTGRAFNWVFLNNGFHTIHHMRPGLHWSVLPEAHAAQVAPYIHPALEVERFGVWFWQAIVWPGRRERFDGAAYEGLPGGEGPDLPWAYDLDEDADAEFGPRPARKAS